MNVLVAVLIMALVTYIPRALPVTLFTKEIKSRYINSFLYYIPYAVLSALTFPDIFTSTGNFLTSLVGTVTALILGFFKQSLVVVALGAVFSALACQLIVNFL